MLTYFVVIMIHSYGSYVNLDLNYACCRIGFVQEERLQRIIFRGWSFCKGMCKRIGGTSCQKIFTLN